MIIDFHTHIGKDADETAYSLDELYSDMKTAGITKSAVFPFSTGDKELISESIQLLDAAKKDARLIPFLRFNPNTVQKEELKKLLSMDFAGVKLHPNSQSFLPSSPEFFWIYEMIEKKSIPLLFHNRVLSGDTSDPKHVIEVAKQHPSLNIIIGHFFGDAFSIIDSAKKLENVYTETSIYARKQRLRHIVLDQGFDRILFGSDAPFDDSQVALLKITKSGLPKQVIDKILYENAESLLKQRS
jgi:hypothetical protein